MTDDEYKSFLAALAVKHLSSGIMTYQGHLHPEQLQINLARLSRTSRLFQLIRMDIENPVPESPFGDKGSPQFYRWEDAMRLIHVAPIMGGFDVMERTGVMAALDDGKAAVFRNLRRSAIPEEDIQFLAQAGFENPELEVTNLVEYAKARWSAVKPSFAQLVERVQKPYAEVLERLMKEGPPAPPRPRSPEIEKVETARKRKIFNGIGKILGGAVSATGNMLMLCGTIAAPNPATAYGAIASSALAVSGVFAGIGDLRGE